MKGGPLHAVMGRLEVALPGAGKSSPKGSTAARQQHQAHPPSLERRAQLGASVPEGFLHRPVAQRGRLRPVKIKIDGAVMVAPESLMDVSAGIVGLRHNALRRPIIKNAIGARLRVASSRPEDFPVTLICR